MLNLPRELVYTDDVNYYIAKPFDVVQLIASVNKYIAARKEL